jgi:hypothetical protein
MPAGSFTADIAAIRNRAQVAEGFTGHADDITDLLGA